MFDLSEMVPQASAALLLEGIFRVGDIRIVIWWTQKYNWKELTKGVSIGQSSEQLPAKPIKLEAIYANNMPHLAKCCSGLMIVYA